MLSLRLPNAESEASPKKPMNLYIIYIYVIYIYIYTSDINTVIKLHKLQYVMHSHHFLTPQLGAESCKLVLVCG